MVKPKFGVLAPDGCQGRSVRPVRRQQLVYAAVNELIRDGSVHAVNIKALTPDEAEG